MLATALYMLATASAAEVEPRNNLNVTGVGEVYVAPDEAVLSLGVRSQANTAAAAFDKAAQKMTAVTQALGQQVTPENIRTSQLSLQPRYEYNEKTGPRLVGYEASAILDIRVDDPTKAGSVLDAAVGAGANEVLAVVWKVEDEAAAQQEALDAAVTDARENAALVAINLGVELGEPMNVSIRTQDTTPPGPIYMERAGTADADISAMPVLAGEQIYRAEVDVTFALAGAVTPKEEPGPEEEPGT
ncbi:MAG: SIMPL domain-containing protein [Pseudomonadota bacterium]|nr:SIMPL domain-containing protein [Pseudomonadota bacterium]